MRLTVFLSLLLLGATPLSASDARRTERVQFAAGAESATVSGSVTGYAVVNHLVGAEGGQQARLSMTTDNLASYFNLIGPDGAAIAGQVRRQQVLRNGGCRMAEGRRWCQVATLDQPAISGWAAGDFQQESAPVGCDPAPQGTQTVRQPGTAERAGRGAFDPTGAIPGKQLSGQPTGLCIF